MLLVGTEFANCNTKRAMITILIKALISMPRLARTAWEV